jgi:DNA-directed RNA polymerase specialized sigma24 family protein
MDAGRRRDLERVMAGLADGDLAMVAGLVAAFGGELRRTLVALARVADLPRPPEHDLDGLVYEAAAAIARVAHAWDPAGGALPWVWARQRLLRVLRDDAGPPVVLLREAGETAPPDAAEPWEGPEPPAVEVLAGVAHRLPAAALVHAALERAVPPADRELLLRHAQQIADGDPSPAVTVGRELGRSSDAVRQAVHRSRRRLAGLARDDERFEPLLRLPLLGAARARADVPTTGATSEAA